MKTINTYILLLLLSFSSAQSEQGDNRFKSLEEAEILLATERTELKVLENEYTACMQKAEKQLFENVKKDAKVHPFPNTLIPSWSGNTNFDKFAHARFGKQCDKCLLTYAVKFIQLLKSLPK